jgi:acyl carrier protein
LHSLQGFVEQLFPLLQVPIPRTIDPDLLLTEDLDIDSIQTLELVLLTEHLAGLWVPPADIPLILTLGDAYDYYKYSVDFGGHQI